MYHQIGSIFGNMPRLWKRVLLIAFDAISLAAALWASYALRYGSWTPPDTPNQFLVVLSAPVIAIPIFVRLGLYRAVIRYLPERALWTILQAMTIATVCWVVLVFLIDPALRGVVPRSVPILYWTLGAIAVAGSRFAAKQLLWPGMTPQGTHRPVLIYGAGEAGAHLATALRRQASRRVVGFLDDNASLHGRDVAGVRVFSPTSLPVLVRQYGVREVILSITSLSSAKRQHIVAQIGGLGVQLRQLPHLADLASGRYLVSQIREIDVDELLGRSSVPPNTELIRGMVEGRTILVTGAGGSIGSELCRLIVRWSPRQIILFEANEFALYQIERELRMVKDRSIVPVLGSIIDRQRVDSAISQYDVEVVFHAAAHKHVPLVEANALEGIRNNVVGTLTVANLAFERGVKNFVLISSDKAVRPTNVMGASKRWAELIVLQKAIEARTKGSDQLFSAVRFGNVLGSNGSVVPLFKEQIAGGGPLTLTDPEMRRYFMSIHEAAELIVQAGAIAKGGDVFLLDMGEPVLIKDLAENMIRISGFTVRDAGNPNGDIELVITGKRPGEKLYEELFYQQANAQPTRHPKIMRSAMREASHTDLDTALRDLHEALAQQDEQEARRILFSFIQQ